MNIQEFHKQIQDAKHQPDLRSITKRSGFVLNNPKGRNVAKHLLSMLQSLGKIVASGDVLDENTRQDAEKAWEKASSNNIGVMDVLLLIDTDHMKARMEALADAASKISPPPSFWADPEGEEKWQDWYADIKEDIVGFMVDVLRLEFLIQGLESITQANPCNFLGIFSEISAHSEHFRHFSKEIIRIFDGCDLHDPNLQKFIKSLRRYTSAGFYRKIVSPRMVAEITERTTGENHDALKLPALSDASIALSVLSDFINEKCLAITEKGLAFMQMLPVTADFSGIPYVKIGDKTFSLHIHSAQNVDGYGINKDCLMDQIEANGYSHGIFFSMKKYPGGAALIRFDRVADREAMKQLVGSQTPLIDDFIRMPFKEVFALPDTRDEFLAETARMVI